MKKTLVILMLLSTLAVNKSAFSHEGNITGNEAEINQSLGLDEDSAEDIEDEAEAIPNVEIDPNAVNEENPEK